MNAEAVVIVVLFTFIIIGLPIIATVQIMNRPQYICTQCGSVGQFNKKSPGSWLLMVFLLFCFVLPGILYWIWRVANHKRRCDICDSTSVVPVTSPVGQKLLQQHGTHQPPQEELLNKSIYRR